MSEQMPIKEQAEKMASDGFCTHYPGYVCDKEWPKHCPVCIGTWLRFHPKERLPAPPKGE